jgi:hypothetical protein
VRKAQAHLTPDFRLVGNMFVIGCNWEKIVADFAGRTTEEQRRDAKAELIRIGRAIVDSFDDEWTEWERTKLNRRAWFETTT